MTLTHIIPSLRRTLPDPFRRDCWPEHTVPTTTDVTVAGVSLLRLVEWCNTPCVHTAAAVIPGTGGRVSETATASVVIMRVLGVEPRTSGGINVWIDARLDECHPALSETRMIGRASTAHTVYASLQPVTGGEASAVELPSDLRTGDLLVVPCAGPTSLHTVRPMTHHPLTQHPVRLSDDRPQREYDEFPLPHCER